MSEAPDSSKTCIYESLRESRRRVKVRQFKLSSLFQLMAAVAVVAAVVAGLAPLFEVGVWDGRFQLLLAIETDQPISTVFYSTFRRRDLAELVTSGNVHDGNAIWRTAELDGDTYAADIPCSGRIDGYGRELGYSEPRFIVIRIEYANQTEVRKSVVIPRGRGSRSVTIRSPKPAPL